MRHAPCLLSSDFFPLTSDFCPLLHAPCAMLLAPCSMHHALLSSVARVGFLKFVIYIYKTVFLPTFAAYVIFYDVFL